MLLLFALVLGLSALVAAAVSPPEEDEEPAREAPTGQSQPGATARLVRFEVPERPARADAPTRRVPPGSRLSVEVAVPRPGEVTISALGLRQSGDPLAPARFDLLAPEAGRYAVVFEPVRGPDRVVGRIAFAEPATVRRRERGR